MTDRVDLGLVRRVHVVGVGGAGMCAIAEVLHAMGHAVTGSDLKESATLQRLRALGITVSVGHDPANVGAAELLVHSSAVSASNPELGAARAAGVPVFRRAEVLAAISRLRPTIAVAGTHGKTTASSMLALVLGAGGRDPGFIIGGDVNEIGSGARWSGDPQSPMVIEADESDGTFLELEATAALVTSLEPDHLDHYGDSDLLRDAFDRFVAGSGPLRVVSADDDWARELATAHDATTYGTDPGATFRIVDVERRRAGIGWTVRGPGADLLLELPVPGLHNARNATGALATATALDVAPDLAVQALGRFAGVARRFEFRGEAGGVTFVDDYAHLPTEVAAALSTARDGRWDRIVCVFQPHRYTRTAALGDQFGGPLSAADVVFVTDVYPAGERPLANVSGEIVARSAAAAGADVRFLAHRDDAVEAVLSELRPGDLCLTLGAGDLTSLPDLLLARL